MNNYIINKNLDYIEEFDIWDIKTVFNYIISKPIEFLLLLVVFVIIYFVDYISQINNAIYSVSQSIPILSEQIQRQSEPLLYQEKKKKKKRNK